MGRNFVPVFESARLYEWDAAKAHLEESGVPCFGQVRSATGLVEAVAQPASGPGISFVLMVPPDQVARARDLLGEIGFSCVSQVEQFPPDAAGAWRRLAILALIVGLIVAASQLSEFLAK